MYLSFITGNILQKFSPGKKNIIFYPQNNLFDHSLFELVDHNYYIFNDNKLNYNISNVIDLPKSYIDLYNYNLSITSNIISYSTSNLKRFHINSIIFTHSYRPHFIKKEDASILNNNLSREHKVFFSNEARDSWGMKNRSHVIKYGIPKAFKVINNDRPKDILILNLDKSIHNSQLHRILQSNYSCDMLDSYQMDIEKINETYNQYKVCIDLAEHNVSNLLCSIAAGCKAVTFKTAMINNEYGKISGLYLAESPADIPELVDNVLKNNSNISDNSSQIADMYDFDIFAEAINDLIEQTNKEAFIL